MIWFKAGTCHINDDIITKKQSIVNALQDKRQEFGFIDVDTSSNISEIQQYVSRKNDSIDSVVVLGIWGSALGAKALLESLYGKYYNEDRQKKGKNIYILDNIDPDTFSDVENIIDVERTLFIFISKSGGTIEPLSQYVYYKAKLQALSSEWKQHFCFVVGENCSMKEQLEQDFTVFYIPENTGGRFSVFTPVGLLPIAFTWVDISLFLEGISEIKQKCLSQDIEENIALQLAHIQYSEYKNAKNITVFFPYSSRLFQVGEWYKQLIWESIGKQGEGITIMSALWVTDQHSQLQLFQDGPRDKLFITLWVDSEKDRDIHKKYKNLTFQKLLHIEQYSTETSLQNEWVSLCTLDLGILDEKTIAQLLYIFMMQTAYLGELFEINAFDQPGVEKSKIITRQELSKEFGNVDLFHTAFYE